MSHQNSIFRKTSLEQVSSPEQLNDYIKVSRPSVWLILAAVVMLLVGVVVWSVFGTLYTTYDSVAVAVNGTVICYARPEEAADLTMGIPVHIADSIGTVTAIDSTPIAISSDFDEYALYLGGFLTGDFVVPITVDISVPDGTYPAKIILESISPISFILN